MIQLELETPLGKALIEDNGCPLVVEKNLKAQLHESKITSADIVKATFKGIVDIPTSQVDIKAGEQFSDEFTLLNPDSTLPTLLCDDGTVLTDTIAMCIYLESLHPNKPLFGDNPLEYAQVIGWMHTLYVNSLMPIADMLRNQGEMFKKPCAAG